jgi:diguanylate cyclase (GGDEF)-like protein
MKLISHFGIIALFFGFSYLIVTEYRDMTVRITTTYLKSITDHLTGAYNRGILSELILSPKDTIVYVDMDKFKTINDNYGHEIGDEILKLLVRTIKNNVRSSDCIVRMGGDEFLVVLKDCPLSKATEIFSKVQSEFINSHELRPVFSFGASQYNGV